jgi:hypothetical protein
VDEGAPDGHCVTNPTPPKIRVWTEGKILRPGVDSGGADGETHSHQATKGWLQMRATTKRLLSATTAAVAIAGLGAGPASAASDNAGCVGQFSAFFAHGGGGMHRSEVAQGFAHGARPAGLNVYSHVAQFHGTLEECFDQT